MCEQKHPEPTVGAVILNERGEVLIVKSPKWVTYTIPGGHIEVNETMEEALLREVKEEVGLDVEIIRRIGVFDAIKPPEFKHKKHFIFIDFLCRAKNTDVKIDGNEITHFMWIKPEDAIKMVDSFTRRSLELVKDRGEG